MNNNEQTPRPAHNPFAKPETCAKIVELPTPGPSPVVAPLPMTKSGGSTHDLAKQEEDPLLDGKGSSILGLSTRTWYLLYPLVPASWLLYSQL
jgi:hypothetical protein